MVFQLPGKIRRIGEEKDEIFELRSEIDKIIAEQQQERQAVQTTEATEREKEEAVQTAETTPADELLTFRGQEIPDRTGTPEEIARIHEIGKQRPLTFREIEKLGPKFVKADLELRQVHPFELVTDIAESASRGSTVTQTIKTELQQEKTNPLITGKSRLAVTGETKSGERVGITEEGDLIAQGTPIGPVRKVDTAPKQEVVGSSPGAVKQEVLRGRRRRRLRRSPLRQTLAGERPFRPSLAQKSLLG